MVRIVVVDDQKLVREGIKILLEDKEEIEIVGDISSGKEAIEKISLLQPDIALLDITMPDIDGFAVAEKIRLDFPQVKTIMLSSHEEEEYVQKATEVGAKGYLLKSATAEELEWSIKLVAQGYSAIKSELLEKQFSHQVKPEANLASNTDLAIKEEKNPAAVSVLSREDRENLDKLELLMAKKQVQQKYSGYQQQKRRSSLFHTVSLSNAKKTMMSFEFRLLVFIILFCLGFLVFIALS